MTSEPIPKSNLQPKSPNIGWPVDDVNSPAKVKVTSQDATAACQVGVICATGNATPPQGESLEKIHALIFDNQNDADQATQGDAPGNALSTPQTSAVWEVPEIPNARCENSPNSNSDNWLVVWAEWSNKTQDPGKVHFFGQCATETDCEPTGS